MRNSWGNKVPVWKPVYSPERAQPLGVSRQGMAQSIQIGTTGMTLGEYRQGDQVLPILLKDNTVDSFRINDLRTLPVFGTGNETTSLEQVVSEFDFQYRFSNVKDYNRQMVMMAQCDPRRGVNAIAAFNEVWPLVQKEIKVPEGYTMKYFGEQESQVESNEALAKNLPLTFFLMFVTLLFLFRTYRKPTVILLMLPLIFIGIVLGLVLLGKSFDFFSILGLLGLIGMNIKNAIVLVEQIDLEAKDGQKAVGCCCQCYNESYCPRSNGVRHYHSGYVAIVVRRDVRRYGGYDYGRFVSGFGTDIVCSSGSLLCHSKNQRLIAFSYMKLEFIV